MQRKKTWPQKVKLVSQAYSRASESPAFAYTFYQNLFFLNPKIKEYFANTDFEHQHKALMHGLGFMMGFLDTDDENARNQIKRIAQTHSATNMNIHPHHYYYWLEALIMTSRSLDKDWYDDLEYYWREVVSFPLSFIISLYFKK